MPGEGPHRRREPWLYKKDERLRGWRPARLARLVAVLVPTRTSLPVPARRSRREQNPLPPRDTGTLISRHPKRSPTRSPSAPRDRRPDRRAQPHRGAALTAVHVRRHGPVRLGPRKPSGQLGSPRRGPPGGLGAGDRVADALAHLRRSLWAASGGGWVLLRSSSACSGQNGGRWGSSRVRRGTGKRGDGCVSSSIRRGRGRRPSTGRCGNTWSWAGRQAPGAGRVREAGCPRPTARRCGSSRCTGRRARVPDRHRVGNDLGRGCPRPRRWSGAPRAARGEARRSVARTTAMPMLGARAWNLRREKLRLLYVASTRAETRLAVSLQRTIGPRAGDRRNWSRATDRGAPRLHRRILPRIQMRSSLPATSSTGSPLSGDHRGSLKGIGRARLRSSGRLTRPRTSPTERSPCRRESNCRQACSRNRGTSSCRRGSKADTGQPWGGRYTQRCKRWTS